MKYYTGIGSRSTPTSILKEMQEVAVELHFKGYTLRSGKAKGADQAFQLGVESEVEGKAEVYIPWSGFKNDKLTDQYDMLLKLKYMEKCMNIASSLHPAWWRCTSGAKKLHARNVLQILGRDLRTPSSFVLYYAEEDNYVVKGGTATAVNLARREGIPTINLKFDNWRVVLEDVTESIEEGFK